MLGVGIIAYMLTVRQRTSIGVAGLDAAQRFQVDPGPLPAFVRIQVAVRVVALIPAGLLVIGLAVRISGDQSGSVAIGRALIGVRLHPGLAVQFGFVQQPNDRR